MCIVLPARVLAVRDGVADIEMMDGSHATVQTLLTPDIAVGDFVVVDRGMALETIDEAEAESLKQLLAELGDLMEDLNVPAPPPPGFEIRET